MSEIPKEAMHVDKPEDSTSISPSSRNETKPVVDSGSVKIKKKSLVKRFIESIVETDAETVRDYVINEVVIPGIKDILIDAAKDGIDVLFNGKDDRRSGSHDKKPSKWGYGSTSRVSYGSFYEPTSPASDLRTYNHPSVSLDDIVVGSRQQAEIILNGLQSQIDRYDCVSMRYLYDMLDTSCPWTYNSFGWYSLDGAGYRHVRDGYLLEFPRPVVLDK